MNIYLDDFVKSPDAALRCIHRHCGVRKVRLIPRDLRALPSSFLRSRPKCKAFATFYELVYLRLFVVFILTIFGIVNYPAYSHATAPSPAESAKATGFVQDVNVGYIESISFSRPPGRERVVIALSNRTLLSFPKLPLLAVEDRALSVLVKMEDMFVPEHLRRPQGENVPGNIVRVAPHQVSLDGKQFVHLVVDLKERVPYAVRREGGNIILDFNVVSLMDKEATTSARPAHVVQASQPAPPEAAKKPAPEASPAAAAAATTQPISLDFQEANIKSVLRLLAEMGGVNIVSGEDVKGAITVNLRNVSWEQALDVILDVSNLTRRETGNVITVMTVERMKKEEAERASLVEAQRRAEMDRAKAELEKDKERLVLEKERQRFLEEQERQKLALEKDRQRLLAEQEQRKLALEKERLELEARARAEKERPVAKPPVEPSTDAFVDTDIRRVFQLLAEESRKRGDVVSIVAGDDVKGTLTADFKEVPWEQKLDTVLEIKGLAKRRVGNVISVMTMDRMKKEEAERALLLESQRRAELERRKAELDKEKEQLALEKERQRFLEEQERQKLALEQERQRLLEEQERRRLALEKERLELEARVRAEQERPTVTPISKPAEPGTDVFVEMDIRRVFQLLAEESRRRGDVVSIVAGDDVKGTLTADFKDVPWEQKLDTVLEIKGLAKRRVGNVISVMTLDRMKKEEAERALLLESQRRAELERRKAELDKEKEQLALEKERQRLLEEQERRRLALEKERLELEARARAEKERPVVKPPEPGADVFVEMDIRRVFQLLAEESRRRGDLVSIVAGDDVKGTFTADFKDVPWEQKLDTVLEIKGLAKRRVGNVITVMTVERMKKEEAERAAADQVRRKLEQEHREREQKILAEQMKIDQAKRKDETSLARPPLLTRVVGVRYATPKSLQENLQELLLKDQREGIPPGSVRVDEHSNSLIIQATKEDMGRLIALIEKVDKVTPQISIKANIIETTKDTARDLGILWGGVWGQKVGDQGLYVTPGGIGSVPGATTPPGQAFSGGYTPTSGSRGISGQGFGVNFPATAMTGAASGSLGVMFGAIGGNILEVQLNALQKDGKLNILSSPQITTLDNQMAFTENGEKIPYVSIDKDGRPEVKFQDAVLRLEITPNTIDDKTMKMKIIIKKDEVDTTRNVAGNPFIIKKHTETNLIVQDGETIVISGLTRQKNMEGTSGIPWLKDIPVLGWLFKGEGKKESMEEVLIFITPNILKAGAVAGIQTGQP